MKIRTDFVTNSSSTSYIIQANGQTKGDRSARAFAEDFIDTLLGMFACFRYHGPWDSELGRFTTLTSEEMKYKAQDNIRCSKPCPTRYELDINYDEFFLLPRDEQIDFIEESLICRYRWPLMAKAGGKFVMNFGDEDDTVMGYMGDYTLREGAASKRFNVSVKEHLR